MQMMIQNLAYRSGTVIPLEMAPLPFCQLITLDPSRRRGPWQAGSDLAATLVRVTTTGVGRVGRFQAEQGLPGHLDAWSDDHSEREGWLVVEAGIVQTLSVRGREIKIDRLEASWVCLCPEGRNQ